MQPDPQNRKNDTTVATKLDPEKIYPAAKSYEELAKIRRERDKMHEDRKPKHIFVSTSIRLYTILIGLVLVIWLIPHMIGFNIISGVSLSFLISSLLVVYSAWMVHGISSSFYAFGFSASRFLLSYAVTYSILVSVAYLLFMKLGMVSLALIVSLVHFVLVYLLISITFSQSKRTAN